MGAVVSSEAREAICSSGMVATVFVRGISGLSTSSLHVLSVRTASTTSMYPSVEPAIVAAFCSTGGVLTSSAPEVTTSTTSRSVLLPLVHDE